MRDEIDDDTDRARACRGTCARCGREHAMARTAEAEAAARDVAERIRASGRMDYDATVADARFDAKYLETAEGGKMIGALVGRRKTTGERVTLKAFSGQLFGEWRVEGWAPPVGELTHDTAYYKSEHGKIKALSERIAKAEMEERMTRAEVREATAARDDEAKALAAEAKRAKEARRRARADGASDAIVETLDEESRASKRAMSTLKKARDAAVAPKLEILARLRDRIDDMKSERKALSRALQDKIWEGYKLPSLGGQVRPLRDVFHPPVAALPCGCADCAAPKLLAWAHTLGITPTSIAEIWIGASRPRDFRVRGVAYGACRDKCVPIMGHMLCPEPPDARSVDATTPCRHR
jgi:tRNA pseudouridine32 synthase/23S rRNA pseudouridine746 synthase